MKDTSPKFNPAVLPADVMKSFEPARLGASTGTSYIQGRYS